MPLSIHTRLSLIDLRFFNLSIKYSLKSGGLDKYPNSSGVDKSSGYHNNPEVSLKPVLSLSFM